MEGMNWPKGNTVHMKFEAPPKPVGLVHIVNGFAVAAYKKPNRFQRWAMKIVFGFEWREV